MFARLLGWSLIWSPKNGQLMRGPSNYFLYAVKLAKEYLKVSEAEVYQVQEMILKDLCDALEYAKMNDKLVYMTKYIEFMIAEYTQHTEIGSLYGWNLLEDDLLESSINQYKNRKSYTEAIKGELSRGIRDLNTFEDWCMIASTTGRLRLDILSSDFLFCCVGFKKRNCLVFEECEIEFKMETVPSMVLESFEIIYSDTTYRSSFKYCTEYGTVYKFKTEKVGKLKIQSVNLNFSRPNLTLRIDESCLQHQQNSEKNFSKMSLEFLRKCQQTLKSMLQLRVDPLKPKVKFTFKDPEGIVLKDSEIELRMTLQNETFLPCLIETRGITIDLGPEETKDIIMNMRAQRSIFITVHTNIMESTYLILINV